MKRLTVIVLIAALLLTLCGCGGASKVSATAEPEATPAPTPVPSPTPSPEPKSDPATVLVDGLGAVLSKLKDGATVTVTGADGDYYTIDLGGVTVLVEKRFIRLLSDVAFEEWEGYATGDTPVYLSVYMDGEASTQLSMNTAFTVLSKLGECFKVKLEDGTVGFVPADQVSEYIIQSYGGYDGGGYSDGGGGGGGSADGGDITLSWRVMPEKPRVTFLSGVSYPVEGSVLAEGVEAYLMLLSRGDAVRVTASDGSVATLLIDGKLCTVPAAFLLMDGKTAYVSWDGYAQYSAVAYNNRHMRGDGTAITLNSAVKVLEDFGDCYYIEWDVGRGYILHDSVGLSPVVWYSDGGGDAGGGGGGGDWTPPAL